MAKSALRCWMSANRWEYQTARIEGATFIPMGDVPSRGHEELDPDDHITVYCHHGVRSLNVAAWLRQ